MIVVVFGLRAPVDRYFPVARQRFKAAQFNGQGLIELRPGLTPLQAVFQAGGFRETAQPAETIIIRKGEENQPIPLKIDLKVRQVRI